MSALQRQHHRTQSPHHRSHSPHHRSHSPHHRSHSPHHRSHSPHPHHHHHYHHPLPSTRKLLEKPANQSIIPEILVVIVVVFYSIFKASLLWVLPKKYRFKDIRSDTILITGGGAGLGRLIAVEFAKYKPKQIILWGRNKDKLKTTAQVVRLRNVTCHYMVCDVSSRDEVYQRAKEIHDKYGDITILVNNAATLHGHSILDSDPDEYEKTINTNFMAQVWTTKAFLPAMLRRDHGHIVAVNSMLGFMGLAGASDYCMSKFATAGLMEALLLEVIEERKSNVHVTAVHPYTIDTGLFAGISVRFPFLFPPLEKEFAAAQITEAVLMNKIQALLPCTMHLARILKSILPVNAMRVLERFLKTQNTMDTFHGRYHDNKLKESS